MRVLAFGTFDILHPGHEHYLQHAKALGDELFVVIARDETVHAVKNQVPYHSEDKRLAAVQALPYVDHAVLGKPGDKYAIIEEIKPDIIALGYDQTAFIDGMIEALSARGLNPKIVRFSSFKPEEYKSSKLRPK